MREVKINPEERVDDLQRGGLRLIQNPNWFCFGVDAVLLSDFAANSIKPGSRVLDLCSGNGIIPILLSDKTRAEKITGLEINEPIVEMAKRSVLLNNLEDKVEMVAGDVNDAIEIFGKGKFENICCNPPYKESFGGIKNNADFVMVARHEIHMTLEDVVRVSEQMLRPGGKLSMIHRPERLADIMWLMRKYNIEPKRLRMVHPSPGKTATMVLIEGARQGNPKLFLEPPLYVHDSEGNYTEEINKIYGRI